MEDILEILEIVKEQEQKVGKLRDELEDWRREEKEINDEIQQIQDDLDLEFEGSVHWYELQDLMKNAIDSKKMIEENIQQRQDEFNKAVSVIDASCKEVKKINPNVNPDSCKKQYTLG